MFGGIIYVKLHIKYIDTGKWFDEFSFEVICGGSGLYNSDCDGCMDLAEPDSDEQKATFAISEKVNRY